MKILFDPQALSLGYSGMHRYYSSLYEGLVESGVDIVFPGESNWNREPTQQNFLQSILPSQIKRLKNRYTFSKIRKQYYRAISENNYDLLYITAPNFETNFLKYLKNKPYVMTVHDTMEIVSGHRTFFDHPRDTTMLGFLAHQAERVICVSEYTKNDLCKKFLVDEEKTETVYLANFLTTSSETVEHLPDQYLFFAGSRTGRKNFFEWIKAVRPILLSRPELYVVATGPLTESERFFLKKLEISGQVIAFKNVTDTQLNTLYQNAMCLIYPTLYEGFGLPVLEAMANGCPVISSDRTSIPEIAGSAAILIDPLDSTEMKNSLQKILENPNLRKELAEKGLKQSKKFSKKVFIKKMIENFEIAIESYHQK